MIEYFAIPEYVIKGSLKNLNDYGTAKYKDFYTPGTWNAVNFNGGMYVCQSTLDQWLLL